MEITKVEGTDKGDIFLYTLSTCGWCKKTKEFLRSSGVAFRYVDVDTLESAEQESVMEQIRKWNPACSFPTIVVDQKRCIVGFKPEELTEAIGR